MERGITLHKKHGLCPVIPVCYLCGASKNEIALLGNAWRGDDEPPRNLCLDKEPCDNCKALMDRGILLISVKPGTERNPYRTGAICVIKEEAAKRIFGDAIGKSRAAFVDDEAWDKIGLPR